MTAGEDLGRLGPHSSLSSPSQQRVPRLESCHSQHPYPASMHSIIISIHYRHVCFASLPGHAPENPTACIDGDDFRRKVLQQQVLRDRQRTYKEVIIRPPRSRQLTMHTVSTYAPAEHGTRYVCMIISRYLVL